MGSDGSQVMSDPFLMDNLVGGENALACRTEIGDVSGLEPFMDAMIDSPMIPGVSGELLADSEPAVAGRSLTILSVEDDPSYVTLIERYLQEITECSIKLVVRPTISAAFSEFAQQQIDLVLLDYHLGSETGLTFLKAMKAAGHECPVIFVTGRGGEKVAVEALQAGATDYMSKGSVSPNSLRRAIRNAIEKAELQKLINSHRKNLEQSNSNLSRRNREIAGFYHTLSHELKTPLTSIREFTALVHDGVAGEVNETQREYLQIVLESTSQMARCINDLLDVTRLETGKLSIVLERADLGTLVRRVTQAMEPAARDRGIELSSVVDPDLPPALIDENRVGQVVRNLLDNGFKFTPKGGKVSVRVSEDQNDPAFLRVSVRDSGRGIAKEHLDRIFERLYQVLDREHATQAGMGLGLNICKELVQLHGGKMHVESEFGKGSTFSFTVKRQLEPVLDKGERYE